jgi:hypothetical protein
MHDVTDSAMAPRSFSQMRSQEALRQMLGRLLLAFVLVTTAPLLAGTILAPMAGTWNGLAMAYAEFFFDKPLLAYAHMAVLSWDLLAAVILLVVAYVETHELASSRVSKEQVSKRRWLVAITCLLAGAWAFSFLASQHALAWVAHAHGLRHADDFGIHAVMFEQFRRLIEMPLWCVELAASGLWASVMLPSAGVAVATVFSLLQWLHQSERG